MPGAVILSDDFNRADAANLGASWTSYGKLVGSSFIPAAGPAWPIVTNRAASPVLGASEYYASALTDLATPDQDVSVTLPGVPAAGTIAGVVIRAESVLDYTSVYLALARRDAAYVPWAGVDVIALRVTPTGVSLYSVGPEALGVPLPAGAVTVRVRVAETWAYVFVNGIYITAFAIDRSVTATSAGMVASNPVASYLDDFVARAHTATIGGTSFTLRVEAALAATDPLALAEPAWTDWSPYLAAESPLAVSVGTDDALAPAGPGSVNLTLRNEAGRFDPTNPAGPYWPNLLPGKLIRGMLRHDGLDYPLFRAYLESIALGWTFGASTAQLTAIDGLGVLARRKVLSEYTAYVLAALPVVYQHLDRADDTEPNRGSGLVAPLVAVVGGERAKNPGPLVLEPRPSYFAGDAVGPYGRPGYWVAADVNRGNMATSTGAAELEFWLYLPDNLASGDLTSTTLASAGALSTVDIAFTLTLAGVATRYDLTLRCTTASTLYGSVVPLYGVGYDANADGWYYIAVRRAADGVTWRMQVNNTLYAAQVMGASAPWGRVLVGEHLHVRIAEPAVFMQVTGRSNQSVDAAPGAAGAVNPYSSRSRWTSSPASSKRWRDLMRAVGWPEHLWMPFTGSETEMAPLTAIDDPLTAAEDVARAETGMLYADRRGVVYLEPYRALASAAHQAHRAVLSPLSSAPPAYTDVALREFPAEYYTAVTASATNGTTGPATAVSPDAAVTTPSLDIGALPVDVSVPVAEAGSLARITSRLLARYSRRTQHLSEVTMHLGHITHLMAFLRSPTASRLGIDLRPPYRAAYVTGAQVMGWSLDDDGDLPVVTWKVSDALAVEYGHYRYDTVALRGPSQRYDFARYA